MNVRSAESWLKFVLRLNGVLAAMAFVAVVMPQSWLVWCIGRTEPDLSVGFLVSYLARVLSAFFFLAGILLLVFSRDVNHYRVPIRCVAIWCVVTFAGVVIHVPPFLHHLVKQWFFWFVVADCVWGLATAFAILVLQARMRADRDPCPS
jgi:hypothetical protein